jgi:hypothetical protein
MRHLFHARTTMISPYVILILFTGGFEGMPGRFLRNSVLVYTPGTASCQPLSRKEIFRFVLLMRRPPNTEKGASSNSPLRGISTPVQRTIE